VTLALLEDRLEEGARLPLAAANRVIYGMAPGRA
jgi:hypothetical protein